MTRVQAPLEDVDHWLAGAPIDGAAVLFVIGLGEGQLLRALQRRGWRGRIVALEPGGSSPLVSTDRVSIVTGPDYAGLEQVFLSIEPDAESPVIVGDPAVMRTRRPEWLQAARRVVHAWYGARANQHARREHAGRYLLNTLRNLPALTVEGDVASLVGAGTGRPAVVVAAGPTLDANLPDLIAGRERVLLIAVDTALRPLLAAGIHPDVVVAVDPSEANASHLVDLPECPNTVLVAEGSLDPEAVRQFAGRTCFFRVADHHPWPWLRGHGLDRRQLRAWGSVLTTAFDLALTMGCDPIIFAGADLAFTGDRPYARGTTFEEEWRRAEAWGCSIEESWAQRLAAWPETFEGGANGTLVRTAPHLRSFRDWLVTEAGKASGRTVVNATGAGILVGEGVRQSTLAHALQDLRPLGQDMPEAIAGRLRTGIARGGARETAHVPDDVRREWMAFAGVPADDIDRALQPALEDVSHGGPHAAPGTARLDPQSLVGTGNLDDAYLAELSRGSSIRLHVFSSPDQDLLAELRTATRELAANDALVIVDEVGIAAGAQVRQAVDTLLCERLDLWLEYRRFADPASRLTIIRGEASRHAPPVREPDIAKWDAPHQAVATRLAPIIASQLRPRSVVDIGSGAGHWLTALAAHGATDVVGVAARTTALSAVPDLGRRFDVCLCLEVAQWLPPHEQDALIAACVRSSDVVVFSSRAPGAPGSSPHERPLPHWAAAFWRHGYVLDDGLRQSADHRSNVPPSVFDCLVTFRRQFSPEQAADPSPAGVALRAMVLTSAARLHDLYTQRIWWAVRTAALEAAATPLHHPQARLTNWRIPQSRFVAATGAIRVFRFRTEAARWYLTHAGGAVQVFEDQHPLLQVASVAALADAVGGGWTRWRDEVHVKASDGSDPRSGRRHYRLALPSHVAWAESASLRDVLRLEL